MNTEKKHQSLFIRVATIPLILLISAGVFLILMEALCCFLDIPYHRFRDPPGKAIFRFDPELGWAYIPKTAVRMQFGPPRMVDVYIDANGIRVPKPEHRFDPARPSILFIGCSFTMGHGLFYEESFVGQFAGIQGMPYQVVNLGVQGYGSDQALLALKRYLQHFNAGAVVYTFQADHVIRNGNYDRRMVHPDNHQPGTKPLFKLKKGELVLAKKPVISRDFRSSRFLDLIQMYLGRALGLFPPRPVALTRKIVLEMKRLAEASGARFILVDWRWNESDPEGPFENMNIDRIDTLDSAPPGWETMKNPWDEHPDARAGRHVASLILNYFLRQNPSYAEKKA